MERYVRFAIKKLWQANVKNTQQSTVELAFFTAVPMGGVGGMGAKARRLNLLCGVRARSSVGRGEKIGHDSSSPLLPCSPQSGR